VSKNRCTLFEVVFGDRNGEPNLISLAVVLAIWVGITFLFAAALGSWVHYVSLVLFGLHIVQFNRPFDHGGWLDWVLLPTLALTVFMVAMIKSLRLMISQ